MDIIGRAKVIIEGDVDSRSLDTAGSKIGAGLKKGAVIGVAALGTIAVAGYEAFKSFEEAEAASRKLTNVLSNMGQGGAAPAVEKLADELRKLTGIDDEVIKGGQTILATFDAVAQSAGETGGTFERATRASVDMSAVFGSVEGASRALGKALSDPEKAAALLRRSNVILTEEQKNLIAAFVEAGDAAGAQDVILDALEDRYAGTGEAAATESLKIASAMGEIKESLGQLVNDLITGDENDVATLSDSLERLNTELDNLHDNESWQGLVDAVRSIGDAIGWVAGKLGDWWNFWEEVGLATGRGVEALTIGWQSIRRDAGKLINYIGDIPGKLKAKVGDWVDAGESLIGGFVEGLKSKVGGLFDFKTIINNALGLPKSITLGDGPGGIIPDKSFTIKAFAAGGPASGLGLVGERGPELVNFPNGSYVHNNNDTKEMLSGSTTNVFNISTTGGTSDLLQELNWWGKFGPLGVTNG